MAIDHWCAIHWPTEDVGEYDETSSRCQVAWKVRYLKGITGKAVVQVVPPTTDSVPAPSGVIPTPLDSLQWCAIH